MKIKSRMLFIIIFLTQMILFISFSNFLVINPIHENFNGFEDDLKSDNSNKFIPQISSFADDFLYEWNKTWGGIYDDYIDSDNAMAIDSSNNIYIVGWIDITGTGNYNIILIKCNPQGIEQWVKIWDGGASDQGHSILIDNSNEIYVVGMTTSYADPDGDMVIIKYDSDGNQQWNFTWGGNLLDRARVIVKDSLNNYYIAGETGSFGDIDGDVILVKFDSNWVEQWNVTWGGSDRDYANAMEIDLDGNICIVGGSYSADPTSGEADVIILKYSPSGTLIWDEDWGASWTQRGPAIAIDSNNNIYFVGHTFGNPASSMKGHLVKYDTNGNYQWERIWGVDGVYGNTWAGLIIDSYDEIFVSGATTTHGLYPGKEDVILLNYDTSGNQNWYKTWGMPDNERALCIILDSQHNIYLGGWMDSLGVGGYDIFLMKYNNTTNQPPYFNLKTPENKTYTEPMSGYYPATIGFENESIGDSPHGWTEFSEGDRMTSIVDTYNEHKNVFKIYDNTDSAALTTVNRFSAKTHGTIEYWLSTSDITMACSNIIYEGPDWGVVFTIREGYFQYRDSSIYYNIPGAPIPQNNQWYHIRIEFRCNGAPSYQKLNESRFFAYIDGIQYGEFPFVTDVTQVNGSAISLGYLSTLTSYLDAVGYSWDPNYNIGDNLNEGLLVSYDTNIDMNWMGYSLDGGSNRTILGNTAIPMPPDGSHSIQVFGNETMGTMYESDVRYFTVAINAPEITINSPVYSEIFGSTAPAYDLSITGLYEAIWYTMDEGLTNITAFGLTGTIDQIEWDKLTDGIVTITFYTNNIIGYIGSAEVQVIKHVTEGNGGQQIPGYNLIALIGVSCVITLFILKKRTN